MKKAKIQPEQRPLCRPQRKRHSRFYKPICAVPTTDATSAHLQRRPLVDCPFYSLKYSFDELPLDPVKDFIMEKICNVSISHS
ncbi:hypothetical protein GQX74_014935 [Glossina fuscipes]|nr:hypothetical protein GQX74_014935 [Glossina fuscipes]